MGASSSAFTHKQLEEYQELTFFTKKEVLHVHKRFVVNAGKENDSTFTFTDRVPLEQILRLEELRENPFGDRMCQVFTEDGSGNMTFEDFLDMMSVFSDNAPKSFKVHWAFKIYDFDNDEMLSHKDLKEVIHRLTGGRETDSQKLSDEDIKLIINNIYKEAALDNEESLSFVEFEHIISKAPDFVTSFRIRL